MNIQPLNYCRQFLKFAKEYGGFENNMLDLAAEQVKNAVKILLPQDGIIFVDKELRALDENIPLRLPFPMVVFEYEKKLTKHNDVTKNILLCGEVGKHIQLCCIVSGPGGLWYPLPTVGIMKDKFITTMNGYRQILAEFPPAAEPHKQFLSNRVSVVVQALNALACTNVQLETPKTLKGNTNCKSALPFDSYKIMTVESHNSTGNGVALGFDRHSPREHLRRGHIRRYENGTKTWVNAHTVSRGTEGKIIKDYAIK